MHKYLNKVFHRKLTYCHLQSLMKNLIKEIKNTNKMLLPQYDIWSTFSLWKHSPYIQHLSKPMTLCAGEKELQMKKPDLAAFSSSSFQESDHSWKIRNRNYCYNKSGCDPDETLKGGLISGTMRGDQIRLFSFFPSGQANLHDKNSSCSLSRMSCWADEGAGQTHAWCLVWAQLSIHMYV